jgi:hypothetical protein
MPFVIPQLGEPVIEVAPGLAEAVTIVKGVAECCLGHGTIVQARAKPPHMRALDLLARIPRRMPKMREEGAWQRGITSPNMSDCEYGDSRLSDRTPKQVS